MAHVIKHFLLILRDTSADISTKDKSKGEERSLTFLVMQKRYTDVGTASYVSGGRHSNFSGRTVSDARHSNISGRTVSEAKYSNISGRTVSEAKYSNISGRKVSDV